MNLSERVERLERQNKRLRLAMAAVCILAAAGGAMAQALPKGARIADAETIRLLDADGKVRAKLTIDATNRPGLVFYDTSGKPRAVLSDQTLGFVRGDGKPQVTLSAAVDGKPDLTLSDIEGHPRARIGVSGEGAGVTLFDAKRVGRAGLSVGSDGAPGMVLLDSDGKRRAVLGVAGNHPGLLLLDPNGKPRAGLSLIDDKPRLELRDAAGRDLYSAP